MIYFPPKLICDKSVVKVFLRAING